MALLRAGNISGCKPPDTSGKLRVPPSRRSRNVKMSEARALLKAGNLSAEIEEKQLEVDQQLDVGSFYPQARLEVDNHHREGDLGQGQQRD